MKFRPNLLAGLLPALSLAAGAPPLARVNAPAPGLYRVRIEGALLARHEGGWSVRDADGRPVPHHLLVSAPGGERPVQVTDLREDEAGWTITLDTGEPLAMHDRVRLRPSAPVLAERCALEFGDAPDRFTAGGAGRLFSLGRGGNLQKAELSYAPTARRFLRVHWPRAAGFPQFEDATVDGPPFDAGERFEPLTTGEPETFSGGRAWSFPPSPALARARGIAWTPAGCRGWRWLAGRNGEWRPLANGGCAGAARLSGGQIDAEDALRLELYGEAPELRSARLAWPVVEVWLLAPGAGVYELAPREGLRTDYPLPAESLGRVPTADLAAAPVGAAPFEAGDLTPFQPLPDALDWQPARRWPVAAEAGRWNELPLPDGEESAADGFFLLADGHVVPALRAVLPVPARELEAGAAAFALSDDRYALALPVRRGEAPAPSLSLPARCVQLELTSPAVDFDRDVALVEARSARPGLEERPPEIARTRWRCTAGDGVCALALRACPGPRTDALRLEIDARNQPPLPPLRIAAWRPVTVLRFLAPARPLTLAWDPVRRVGDFPAFEVARARAAGLVPRPARISGPLDARAPAVRQRVQRGLLLGGLAITGALLLYIVVRLLPGASAKSDPP